MGGGVEDEDGEGAAIGFAQGVDEVLLWDIERHDDEDECGDGVLCAQVLDGDVAACFDGVVASAAEGLVVLPSISGVVNNEDLFSFHDLFFPKSEGGSSK